MTPKSLLFTAVASFISFLCFAQGPAAAPRDIYDWQKFDAGKSSVKKEDINFHMLQGVWYAYEGWYYGDEEKFWKDYNHPRVFRIQGNQFRASTYSPFVPYRLHANLITYPNGEKTDSAYINLLTDKKMIMSFRRGTDFEKYIFQR